MIYYYPCEVYLTEPTKKVSKEMDMAFDTNIRHYLPDKLNEIIKQVIMTDFSVTIYGAEKEKEVVNLLQQLVSQEGLFLIQNEL